MRSPVILPKAVLAAENARVENVSPRLASTAGRVFGQKLRHCWERPAGARNARLPCLVLVAVGETATIWGITHGSQERPPFRWTIDRTTATKLSTPSRRRERPFLWLVVAARIECVDWYRSQDRIESHLSRDARSLYTPGSLAGGIAFPHGGHSAVVWNRRGGPGAEPRSATLEIASRELSRSLRRSTMLKFCVGCSAPQSSPGG